jgi:hypothetical protein
LDFNFSSSPLRLNGFIDLGFSFNLREMMQEHRQQVHVAEQLSA